MVPGNIPLNFFILLAEMGRLWHKTGGLVNRSLSCGRRFFGFCTAHVNLAFTE